MATNSPQLRRILVAPLDWGLGHAARCIPLIRQLLQAGCEVLLAGEGSAEALLRAEFPQLAFLPLRGYRVGYAKTRWGTITSLIRQLPKINRTIQYEQQWLQQVVQAYEIDVVISDNRYGLHHPSVYSVFITHQLLIKTPLGKRADAILQKWNYRYINRFNECWVPDVEDDLNLAGELSHPVVKPKIPITYIGPLSRFVPDSEEVLTHYLLILLSGPEPQRTLLEQSLLAQLQHFQKPVLFVRGLPGQTGLPKVPYHVTIVNHLSTNALQKALEGASFVIARTGYSTVMDLMTLQKKSILMPTPGQTEQEYLATHLMKHALAFCLPQAKLQLNTVVGLAETFNYFIPPFKNEAALQTAVKRLLEKVNSE